MALHYRYSLRCRPLDTSHSVPRAKATRIWLPALLSAAFAFNSAFQCSLSATGYVATFGAALLSVQDPHGIEILATYKFGSCAMSNLADLAVPGIRWLGVHAADFAQFKIPAHAKLVLGERERARSFALAGRECMSLEPLWLYAQLALHGFGC